MIIGLTGGIGVGKSFIANCFKEFGAAVFDADFIVHQLYRVDKNIISYAEKNFPGAIVNGEIDKTVLSKYFLDYDENWKQFQSLVHSAVRNELEIFIAQDKEIDRKFLVLDVPPLLKPEHTNPLYNLSKFSSFQSVAFRTSQNCKNPLTLMYHQNF